MSQAEYLAFDDAEQLNDEKAAIKAAFGRAAITYDNSAAFQRRVGDELLGLNTEWAGKTVLDLGCGTGYFTKKLIELDANVVALDLSEQMLDQAKQRCGDNAEYVSGDAERLPFEDNCFDIAFSSLALQWCQDLSVPLRELKRVVKPGGKILFSTLIDGSLHELKHAWQHVDLHQHVNEFLTLNQVNLALAQAGVHTFTLECKPLVERYPSAMALMRDLKGIGATHLSEGRNAGLSGKARFRH